MKRLCAAFMLAFLLASCGGKVSLKEEMGLAGTEYQYEGNTVRYSVPEATVEVSYLSPAGLDLYFSMFKEGRYKNPFPPGPYLVLSLSIENKSGKSLTYDPRRTQLLPAKGSMTLALDYSSLYTDFDLARADDLEERMDTYRVAALENTVLLRPGEKVSGLVVFSRPREAGEGPVVVVVDRVYLDHEPVSMPFLFAEGMP